MKKFFLFLMLCSMTTVFVSCDKDDDVNNSSSEEPTENVLMGIYEFYFPTIHNVYWPDNDAQEELDNSYAAYEKSLREAVKVEAGKLYKWSDILAQQNDLTKKMESIGDFEYTVKACRNYGYNPIDIYMRAVQDTFAGDMIYLGKKKIVCKIDIPSDVTCQLYIEIVSNEIEAPAAKDYNAKVIDLYKDALKDVVTGDYSVSESHVGVQHMNLANCKGNSSDVIAKVKKACTDVVIPEVPEDVKSDILSNSRVKTLFQINIYAYDPSARNPSLEEEVFTSSIVVK